MGSAPRARKKSDVGSIFGCVVAAFAILHNRGRPVARAMLGFPSRYFPAWHPQVGIMKTEAFLMRGMFVMAAAATLFGLASLIASMH